MLEWVYGSIVSTAEKSRDGAKRQLGLRPPTAQQAYDNLMRALEDQASWESRAKTAKALLNDMLRSRKDADELSKRYDIRPVPPPAAAAAGSTAADAVTGAPEAAGEPESVIVPDEVSSRPPGSTASPVWLVWLTCRSLATLCGCVAVAYPSYWKVTSK